MRGLGQCSGRVSPTLQGYTVSESTDHAQRIEWDYSQSEGYLSLKSIPYVRSSHEYPGGTKFAWDWKKKTQDVGLSVSKSRCLWELNRLPLHTTYLPQKLVPAAPPFPTCCLLIPSKTSNMDPCLVLLDICCGNTHKWAWGPQLRIEGAGPSEHIYKAIAIHSLQPSTERTKPSETRLASIPFYSALSRGLYTCREPDRRYNRLEWAGQSQEPTSSCVSHGQMQYSVPGS